MLPSPARKSAARARWVRRAPWQLPAWPQPWARRTCRWKMPQRSRWRSEEHTSELQSLMRISYAVFCLKKKKQYRNTIHNASDPTTKLKLNAVYGIMHPCTHKNTNDTHDHTTTRP